MKRIVLAADLGGTNLRLAAVRSGGDILHSTKRPIPKCVTPVQLCSMVREMADECSDAIAPGIEICAVAFTAPAPVAKDFDGVLTKLPNIPSLVGMNLKRELAEILNLPITVENDATAAGIGEDWIGASKDVATSVCVTLGTGIGGGIIINGEPLRGLDGTAGEIGHICVEPDGLPCGCGSHGCIEQYASAPAIERMALDAGMNVANAKEVYDEWAAGDELARSVFDTMGRYLGIALAGLVNTLNPEMIVICGGVTEGWDAFNSQVEAEIAARAYPAASKRAKLVKGKLGDNAGLLGAAKSAFLAL